MKTFTSTQNEHLVMINNELILKLLLEGKVINDNLFPNEQFHYLFVAKHLKKKLKKKYALVFNIIKIKNPYLKIIYYKDKK